MSCYNSRSWLQRNGNKWTLELKVNWSNQDDTGQSTDDQFEDDWQIRDDCAVTACSPLLLSVKARAPLVASWGAVGLWTDVPPPAPTPGWQHLKWSKLPFPPTWHVYCFWAVSSQIPSSPVSSAWTLDSSLPSALFEISLISACVVAAPPQSVSPLPWVSAVVCYEGFLTSLPSTFVQWPSERCLSTPVDLG